MTNYIQILVPNVDLIIVCVFCIHELSPIIKVNRYEFRTKLASDGEYNYSKFVQRFLQTEKARIFWINNDDIGYIEKQFSELSKPMQSIINKDM